MAKIDVWLQKGRGVFGFVQRMKEPVFVVLLKNQATDQLTPVYADACEAEPGNYQVILYHAYDADQFRSAGFLTINPQDTIVRLVLSYAAGDLFCHRECRNAKNTNEEQHMWEEYMQSNAGRLSRHLGWNTSSALKMMNS